MCNYGHEYDWFFYSEYYEIHVLFGLIIIMAFIISVLYMLIRTKTDGNDDQEKDGDDQ